MADIKIVACGGCCLATVIVGIILIIIGFSSLEFTELGLRQSWLTSSISDVPYTSGRYFIGPGNSFLKFPNTLQTIAFSEHQGDRPALTSRTSDGLELDVDCSFQYQLSSLSIYQLYNKFGPSYRDIFLNIAIETITAEATHYTAAFWFRNLTTIESILEEQMQLVFNTTAFADVTNFQLTSIVLPHPFELEITQTEVQRQQIITANQQRARVEVQKQTEVIQAERQALEININANAVAQAKLLEIRSWIEPFKLQQENQATAYAPLFELLGNDEDQFLDYLGMRIARDHPMDSAIFSHGDL